MPGIDFSLLRESFVWMKATRMEKKTKLKILASLKARSFAIFLGVLPSRFGPHHQRSLSGQPAADRTLLYPDPFFHQHM